jgi:hypothetical protein
MLSGVFNPTVTGLIARIHDGNPEPKTYFEEKASKERQNGGKQCEQSFKIWKKRKFETHMQENRSAFRSQTNW